MQNVVEVGQGEKLQVHRKAAGKAPELWGGVECTINRVGENYFQQLGRSGHDSRLSDLDEFATLGIAALRHPVLWEEIAPNGLSSANWAWADVSLQKLRELNIRPVVGLMHHGSGPRSTNLLDPEFPTKLSAYAAAVARRYPWVEDYTPVNEPLTTARFSALYGHWYPHHCDDLSFARALLNQCRAVVLSMREINKVNSSARLIQTEDLGKAFSTPKLAYQAELENERRWCTWDLLSGRLTRDHAMWQRFISSGIDQAELEWFLDNAYLPAIVGVNHYLSGVRYLDEHLSRYPEHTHGGNGRDEYADILAARVLEEGTASPESILMEAWERYKLPIAITECHNGCTREEQLRWFHDVWQAAEQCIQRGADIRAVTAWSLLGAFDWNQLVTRNDGHYEPGVYDVRFGKPKPTALVGMMQSLGTGHILDHPVLQVPGWWKRSDRFVYGIAVDKRGATKPINRIEDQLLIRGPISGARPILISGGGGTLGQAFARICERRGLAYRSLCRAQFDIADQASVHRALATFQPWAIINAAGFVNVDEAELHRSRCYRENTEGPSLLASECAQRNIQLLTFSTDLVFGTGSRPLVESDHTAPKNYYGISKVEAERRVLAAMPSALVVRTSAFFGPWDEYNFLAIALQRLQEGLHLRAATDAVVSPTYVPDLVNTCLDLLVDGDRGIWHLANRGAISWAALAEEVANAAGVSARSLQKCKLNDLQLRADRPLYSALDSERARLLPPLDDALGRFLSERDVVSTPSFSMIQGR